MKTILYVVAVSADSIPDESELNVYSDYEMARRDAFMVSQMEDGETYQVFEVEAEIKLDTVKVSR